MREMVPLEEARQILMKTVKPLEVVEMDLLKAVGLVLAKDIIAPRPFPPFDRSPLDGFAFRSVDTTRASAENPVKLYITETIYAGHAAKGRVEPGIAAGIATGAPIPPGADCVARFEDTRQEGQYVIIYKPFRQDENIIQAGEEIAGGELALPAGQELNPPAVATLAALGYTKVPVYRRPRVSIFSTGDELLPLGRPLLPGKIYNSNLYAIAAQVAEAGGEAVLQENAGDDEELVGKQFIKGLDMADLVISTGGVSVGKRDVVKKAMESAGAELLFWKVACKPGKPVTCGLRESRLLIGLSGNPAAATVMFTLLVRPLLRLMSGRRELYLPRVQARLAEDLPKGGKMRSFIRAVVRWQDGYVAWPVGKKGRGMLKSLAEGNALIDIPEKHGFVKTGDSIEVLLL